MRRTAKHYGFSRTKKMFVAIVTLLATIMLIVPITSTNAYAESADTRDLNVALLPYAQELEKINLELGTDYVFASEGELSDAEFDTVVNLYQQMTLKEFREYVYEGYKDELIIQSNQSPLYFENLVIDTEVYATNPETTVTQKYFYDGSSDNYLYIKATVMFGSGRAVYHNHLGHGDSVGTYPAFLVTNDFAYDFSSDQSEINCIFYCHYYPRSGYHTTSTYSFPVTFNAGGGNVYDPIVKE